MFVPDSYHAPKPCWAVDLIRGFPLATLCTEGGGVPYVTHLPVVFRSDQHVDGTELPGTILVGHMNRANPHWRALGDGCRAVVVFAGPHGYVSPSVYGFSPAAPTWDFTSVHVIGRVRPLQDEKSTIDVVTTMVRTFESDFGTDWDMTKSISYFRKILPGVGAFEIEVERVDSMFKLSQEQPTAVRRSVAESFADSTTGLHRELAALISRLPE
jgi:transcriptional regulator